jgi:hypothetical protein
MVAKKSSGKRSSRVKVGKLKLTKETVKDLTKTEAKKIKGGGTRKTCARDAICGATV